MKARICRLVLQQFRCAPEGIKQRGMGGILFHGAQNHLRKEHRHRRTGNLKECALLRQGALCPVETVQVTLHGSKLQEVKHGQRRV